MSTLLAPSALTSNKTVTGIDVIVRKSPGNISSRMIAEPNPDGSFSVKLPGPGKYTISYADGPNMGKVIQTVTATIQADDSRQ